MSDNRISIVPRQSNYPGQNRRSTLGLFYSSNTAPVPALYPWNPRDSTRKHRPLADENGHAYSGFLRLVVYPVEQGVGGSNDGDAWDATKADVADPVSTAPGRLLGVK